MDLDTLKMANHLAEQIDRTKEALKELNTEKYHTMMISYGDIRFGFENKSIEFYTIKEMVSCKLERLKDELDKL